MELDIAMPALVKQGDWGLVALSVGLRAIQAITLGGEEIKELVALWKENYYEF